jgi:TolB-like protein/DNA-binding winged helix-turn-helix (wHTH) protein/Tfp pilus assembly protein PilF
VARRRFYEFDQFRLDAAGRVLYRGEEIIPLSPKAADVLLLLLQRAGEVVEKEELLKQVWQDAFVEEGSLTRAIFILRKALGDRGEEREWIATVPKRGYRFAIPVRVRDEGAAVLPETPVAESATPPRPSIRLQRVLAGLGAALLLLTLGSFLIARLLRARPSVKTGKAMLVVLPFQNLTGDPNKEFVADGMTEEMIGRLGSLNPEQLGVIARTSAMTYKGSKKPASQIATELAVNYILEGSVRSWGDRVRVSAQLIQATDQTHLWAESYERSTRDILALESDAAEDIAQQIRVTLAPKVKQTLARTRPVNPEAYEACLKGRYFWYKRTAEGLSKGIEFFNQAIAAEPNYAPAYVGLADSYLMLAGRGLMPAREAIPKAKAAVKTALQIDDELGEAHASLGHIRLHDWDWEGLDSEFQRAIELNPGYAIAYYYYSEYLMTTGKSEASIAMVKKVQEIDPVSPVLNATLPSQYYFARMYDPAIDYLRKAIEIDPSHFLLHLRLADVYLQKGMTKEAVEEKLKAAALSGRSAETVAGLGQAYAAAGMTEQARSMLEELKQISKSRYVSPYSVSKIYTALGDNARAFQSLEQAYEERNVDMIELKADPVFDNIRSDPRFAELLHKVGWRD